MAYSELGITQTDEYEEVFERFLEEYDGGKPVADICADIFSDYAEEFGADSPILYGVYYGIAKAQWMCGGVSNSLVDIIGSIISNELDLAHFRSMGADAEQIKVRKRNLDRFYKSLLVPRKTVRRRKKDESEFIPVPRSQFAPLPAVFRGSLLSYPYEDGYRMLLVMDIIKTKAHGRTAYCFIWPEKFCVIPDYSVLLKRRGLPLGIVSGDAFPDLFEVVETVTLERGTPGLFGYAYPMWRGYISKPIGKERFYKAFPTQLCLNLETAMNRVSNIMNGIR